jgi:UDP-glucose 4-epimerase
LLGGEVEHIPKRPGEPDCTYADVTKIQKLLGWHPQVSFEQGVSKMLQSINDWNDAPVWDSSSIAQATEAWFNHLGNTD